MNSFISNFKKNTENIKHIVDFKKVLFVLFCLLYCCLIFLFIDLGIAKYKTLLFIIGALVVIGFFIKDYRLMLKAVVFSAILFLIIGELYFRMHFLGLDSIKKPNLYVPAGIGSPLSNLQYDEDLSYTGLKPETHGVFKGAPLHINNYGFRDSHWDFNESKYKIAVFGTSISMGPGVNSGENYADQLEKMLNLNSSAQDEKIEVFNFGIGRYGMDDILDVIDTYEAKLDPDIIIIEAYGFDNKGLHQNKKFKGTKKDLFSMALKQPYEIFFLFRSIKNEFFNNIRVELSSFVKGKSRVISEEPKESYFKEIKHRFEGKAVYILSLRPMRRLKDKLPVSKKLKELCKKYGFELIDTYKENYGSNDMEMILYPGDRHPNKNSHKIYANSIYKSLQSHGLFTE